MMKKIKLCFPKSQERGASLHFRHRHLAAMFAAHVAAAAVLLSSVRSDDRVGVLGNVKDHRHHGINDDPTAQMVHLSLITGADTSGVQVSFSNAKPSFGCSQVNYWAANRPQGNANELVHDPLASITQ